SSRSSGWAGRSGLGRRTVQQARHLLLKAVVERFLRRGLGVAAAPARGVRRICGRVVSARRGRLALASSCPRTWMVGLRRGTQRGIQPGGGCCFGRSFARCFLPAEGGARVIALGGAPKRGFKPLRYLREVLVGRRLERGIGRAWSRRRRRLQSR